MSPQTKRAVVAIAILAMCAGGVLFLSWKDIYAEIPTFAQLHEIGANGMRADIGRETWDPGDYSVEFFDAAGRRYQLAGVNKPALDQITTAFSAQVPVVLRYGRWRSPFPSATIFTVYQIEIGKRVIIPYSKLANARHREQAGGPFILLSTALIAGVAIYIAVQRQRRFERELALIKSNHPQEKHPM